MGSLAWITYVFERKEALAPAARSQGRGPATVQVVVPETAEIGIPLISVSPMPGRIASAVLKIRSESPNPSTFVNVKVHWVVLSARVEVQIPWPEQELASGQSAFTPQTFLPWTHPFKSCPPWSSPPQAISDEKTRAAIARAAMKAGRTTDRRFRRDVGISFFSAVRES